MKRLIVAGTLLGFVAPAFAVDGVTGRTSRACS